MKILSILFISLIFIISGCSDSGDTPTGNGGGNGGGEPNLSVADIMISESGTANFTIRISTASGSDVIFNFMTSNLTATSGDFTATSGIDTITAGSTSTIISVAITDDGIIEPAESFSLIISAVSNANISDSVAIALIWDNDGVSFVSDVRPVIQANSCLNSGCHGSGSSQGGMTLGSATYSQVLSAAGSHGKIVVSGNADNSNLYLKTTSNPPFGSRMPLGMTPLTTADQNKLKDWIDQGAQDN